MTLPAREARIARLRQAARDKSESAVAKARRAIMVLESRGSAINFNTVAAEAGVSKDFLYGNADLRRQIAQKRRPPASVVEASVVSSSEKSAAAKLAVATRALNALRAEVEQLRAENATLRGDLHEARRQRNQR